MSNWIDIAALEEIPRLGSRLVKTTTLDIVVFRTASDAVFALKDECPHRGGPLSQGMVHGNTVICPLHNWRINLATGKAKAPDQGCIQTYPVKLENGRVYLQLSRRAAAV